MLITIRNSSLFVIISYKIGNNQQMTILGRGGSYREKWGKILRFQNEPMKIDSISCKMKMALV